MIRRFVVALALFVPAMSAFAGLFGDDTPLGMKKECVEKHSRAWCLTDALKISKHLSDLSKAEFDRALAAASKTDNNGERLIDIAMLTGTATGWISPTPGISKGFSATSILFSMLASNRPSIAGISLAVGWMPLEDASDLVDAIMKFLARLDTAIKQETGVTLDGRTTMSSNLQSNAGYSLNNQDRVFEAIDPKWCGGTADCRLVQIRHSSHSQLYISPRQPSARPAWIGDAKGWYVGIELPEPVGDMKNAHGGMFARAISSRLPSWIYVISPPQSTHTFLSGVTSNPGQAFHVVYNSGKALLPVFPEVDVNSRAASSVTPTAQ